MPGQKILTLVSMTGSFLLPFSLSFSQDKSATLVNINNVTSWIHGDGYHPVRTDFGNGAFPKGTGGFIFTEGIVWGGKVKDDRPRVLRVGGNWFYHGCRSGMILPDGSREPDNSETVRPYRVRRDWKTADLTDDAASYNNKQPNQVTDTDVELLRALYETDWNAWPWEKGAPYIERNGIPGYQPPPPFNDDLFNSDSLISGGYDEPGLAGANSDSPADQVVWTVYNDLDEFKTLPARAFNSDPIGFEVHEIMWAYNRTDPLGNVIFKRVRIIYKGRATTPADAFIDSMYISQFVDPDNGSHLDDYVGCDTTLSLGYVYNSKTTDGTYFNRFGLPPPAGGFDFLQGPIVPGSPTDSALYDLKYRKGYKNLPMTAFTFFSGGAGSGRIDPPFPGNNAPGTPTGTWYNLMAGFEPRPEYPARTPLRDHLGNVTKFELTGDPVRGTGDLDGKPTPANPQRFIASDRRFVMSTGPFTMARGDTQEVVLALVAGLGADYLSSVSVMKFNDRFAQNAYNNLFDLPTMPVPIVAVAELDKEIVLNWGDDLERVKQIEDTLKRGGYRFEGYNVYQLPNATATLEHALTKKIKTFDLVNDITVIIDEALDEKTAVIVTKPVQVGSNSGIQRYLKITRDEIRNTPLVNGQEYHFAVTAYGYNGSPDAASRSLESPVARVRPVPQSPKPGVRYSASVGDKRTVTHTQGTGDADIEVGVIDPTKMTGQTYTIDWSALPDALKGSDVTGDLRADFVLDEAGTAVKYEVRLVNVNTHSGPVSAIQVRLDSTNGTLVKTLPFTTGSDVATATGTWSSNDASEPLNPSLVQQLIRQAFWVRISTAGSPVSARLLIESYPYYLRRQGQTLVSYQRNYNNDESYPVVDGLHVKVSNLTFKTPTTIGTWIQTEKANSKTETFKPEGSGGATIFGSVNDYYPRLFGGGGTGATSEDLVQDLDLRFTGVRVSEDAEDTVIVSGGSIATVYSNNFATAVRLRVPFELWEKDPNGRSRQINAVIRDRNFDGLSPWGSAGAPLYIRFRSGRAYIGAVATPYDSSTNLAQAQAAPSLATRFSAKGTWAIVPKYSGTDSHWDTGDVIHLKITNTMSVGPTGDKFSFTAPAPVVYDATLANEQVNKINVFPNPYFGFNSRETSRLNKYVTFNHLPARATLRIFNLAGVLVNVLEKDDASQFRRWDLRNHNNLPVASGIYIVHIEMPDLGATKILKLALVQEEQVLPVY